MARELARFGIRVVAIAPGVFDTSMMGAMSDETVAALSVQIPFPPRMGRPQEFAQLVCQIFENPMLNGTVIRLDGGLRSLSGRYESGADRDTAGQEITLLNVHVHPPGLL